MKIIKRDGKIVDYNSEKIRVAIGKANNEVSRKEKATNEEIEEIITYIEELNKKRMLVEDIQDIIEEKLIFDDDIKEIGYCSEEECRRNNAVKVHLFIN